MNAFHVYTYMFLPYNRVTKDPGTLIQFFDGVYAGVQGVWSPAFAPSGQFLDAYLHTVDWQHSFIAMQGGINTGQGYDVQCDYVKVLK
jgi:hypothetical protein